MNIFEPRTNYKPFEYPGVLQFIGAINKSFWVHSEVDFTADIQDFHSSLNHKEREVIKRSLLSIAQIEVSVKAFWGDLYKHLPKPEFNGLGSTLAENEFRHSEAYSRLLEVLGYTDEFEKALKNNPIFYKRVEMVKDGLNTENFLSKLLFFAVVIENTSLFSQFANILSFTRFRGQMKNTSNIIAWTSVDEQIHANAGIWLINTIVSEGTPLMDQKEIEKFVKSTIDFEKELLDWIYEEGELDFFTKEDMLNFMRKRIDTSLINLGYQKVFNVSEEEYKHMLWFDEEINSNTLDDFFAKRPVDYTKHDKSITGDDLF